MRKATSQELWVPLLVIMFGKLCMFEIDVLIVDQIGDELGREIL